MPAPLSPTKLQENLRLVEERIERAARAAGREPSAVRLLAVTKGVPCELALELARLGRLDLGENRVEGLEEKAEGFARAGRAVRWHFIGHLQRNKARRVLRHAAVVHSVDSLRLLETLERIASEEGRRPEIFLEVKLSAEPEKHGLRPLELAGAVRAARSCAHLELVGLMTMAPLEPQEDEPGRMESARAVFQELARLSRSIEADAELARAFRGGQVLLSMGMSGDLEEAVAAGAHWVRVGSALYEGVKAGAEREVAG